MNHPISASLLSLPTPPTPVTFQIISQLVTVSILTKATQGGSIIPSETETQWSPSLLHLGITWKSFIKYDTKTSFPETLIYFVYSGECFKFFPVILMHRVHCEALP